MSPEVGGFLPALNSHTIIPKENKSNCLVLIELDSSSGAMYLKINQGSIKGGVKSIESIKSIKSIESIKSKKGQSSSSHNQTSKKNTGSYTFNSQIQQSK